MHDVVFHEYHRSKIGCRIVINLFIAHELTQNIKTCQPNHIFHNL